ncbi:MAG: NAD(+)/NADH kinase [Atopobiaceae bacterium]
MKVLIVPNYSRPDAVADTRKLATWLERRGLEPEVLPDTHHRPCKKIDLDDVRLVVSLGGDGTLLRAARVIGYSEIPVVGISYGHLGFLTSAQPEELLTTVDNALERRMHVSHRATLDIEATFQKPDGSTVTMHRFALNDFSLAHGAHGDMIEFHVSVSGNYIDTLRGDGFVVSTATGSTGYALAAGGPIVTPEFTGLVCVPVAPHTIMARAFLTSRDDVVTLAMSKERPVDRCVFADGQPLGEGMQLVRADCRRGPGDILLLDNSAQSFYDSVSRVFYGKAGQ